MVNIICILILDEATVMMLTRKGDMLKLKVLDTKGHILQELEL